MASPSSITACVFCPHCLEELPDGFTMQEWNRVECGFVPGHLFQVWCTRHQIEVLTVKLAQGRRGWTFNTKGGE